MIQKVDSGEPGCPPGFFLLNYPERGWAGGPPFAIFEGWEFAKRLEVHPFRFGWSSAFSAAFSYPRRSQCRHEMTGGWPTLGFFLLNYPERGCPTLRDFRRVGVPELDSGWSSGGWPTLRFFVPNYPERGCPTLRDFRRVGIPELESGWSSAFSAAFPYPRAISTRP